MSETAQTLPYQLVDMDNHYYEADDCFSRHIESQYKDVAIQLIPGGVDGTGVPQEHLHRWAIGQEPLPFLKKHLGENTRPPGTILGVFEGKISRNDLETEENWNPKQECPEAFDRALRLKRMDEQNIQSSLMLSSMALTMEECLVDRPDAWLANVRSFNRWLEDDWGYGADGRIFAAPLISLLDLGEAVRELERVAALGARAFYFKMGTVLGRSPADTFFDPFWARVNEMGLRPVMHIDNHGYEKLMATGWGLGPIDGYYGRQTAELKFLCEVWRVAHDTVGMLVLQNLFGRFPNIRVLIIESGSDWIAPLLHHMDKSAKGAIHGTWAADHGRVDGRLPSEVFSQHFWVSPFPEEDIPELARTIGHEAVLFGSDWPHSEGEEEPLDYLRHLEGLPDVQVRRIMHDNGATALRL